MFRSLAGFAGSATAIPRVSAIERRGVEDIEQFRKWRRSSFPLWDRAGSRDELHRDLRSDFPPSDRCFVSSLPCGAFVDQVNLRQVERHSVMGNPRSSSSTPARVSVADGYWLPLEPGWAVAAQSSGSRAACYQRPSLPRPKEAGLLCPRLRLPLSPSTTRFLSA
jgi:hypothetical protein